MKLYKAEGIQHNEINAAGFQPPKAFNTKYSTPKAFNFEDIQRRRHTSRSIK